MRQRKSSGNVLFLVLAVLIFVVPPIAFFSERYISMVGAHQEQRSAIEAAAMAAARDLSRIVVDDPNLGLISLSDYAPTGKGTKAGDNYFLPVQSINTVLGTVRLDMIIADQLNSTVMRKCAERDYDYAMQAKDNLVSVLTAAVQPGGSGRDIDGDLVKPYDDAVSAYNSNLIRMNGASSTFVPNSMKLALGMEDNLYTNTLVPQPLSVSHVTTSQRNDTCYRAFVDVVYDNKDFVLAAVDGDTRLVDFRQFKTSETGLPYIIPSIVNCQADQHFVDRDPSNGMIHDRIVHCAACAQASSLGDRRPAPGFLAIDFPTGDIGGMGSLYSICTSNQIMKGPTDLLMTPPLGDCPVANLVQFGPPPLNNQHPPFGDVIAMSIYDWIRCNGTNLNVSSLVNTFTVPFNSAGSAGHTEQFEVDLQGNVTHNSKGLSSTVTLPVAQDQLYSRSGISYVLGIPGQAQLLDIFVRDYVFQPGRNHGGLHAGQPAGTLVGAAGPTINGLGREIDEYLDVGGQLPVGPIQGAVRPTYQQSGISVSLLFRQRTASPLMP